MLITWLSRLFSQASPFMNRRAKPKRRRIHQLRLVESLEDRIAPATVNWTGLAGNLVWGDAGNWDLRVPNSGDDAVINVAASNPTININSSAAVSSLTSQEALKFNGGTFSVGTTATVTGANVTVAGGTLSSGVWTISSGAMVATSSAGTLDHLTVNGTINFTQSNDRIGVTNGLEVNGAINFNHDYTRMEFAGTQSLTGTATVTFGNVYGAALRVTQSQTTLTLGPNIVVRGGSSQQITSRIGFDEAIGGPQDVFVINQGTISADVSGTSIYVKAALTNTGTLEGKSGGYLEASNLVTNSANVTTSASGAVGLYGGWTNTGAITVNGGNLYLGGSFDQTKLGTVNRTTGNVYLTGAWNQTVVPAALNLNSSVGGSVIMLGGAFNGLNITGTLIPTTSGGTLNGVTYNGNLNFQNSNERLTVANGLEVNGAVNFNHDYTRLEFTGTQSLMGTATVNFGNVYGAALRVTQSQTTLTLGPNVLVRGGSSQQITSRIGFDEAIGGPQDVFVINQGTISADVSGTSIYVRAALTNTGTLEGKSGGYLEASNLVTNSANVTTSASGAVGLYGGWTNTGTIAVNGGNLYLGGSFDQTKLGTVNRTTGNVYLTGTWNQTVVPAALNLNSSVGGSVIMLGGAFNGLNITGTLVPTTSGGTLSGVTYNGNLNFQNSNDRLTVTNGLEVNGAINFNHDYTRMEFTGTQSLTGTTTVTFGNVYGAALRVTQSQTTLTLGPNVLVRGGSSQQITSRIGFDEAIGGPQDVFVINQGTISAAVNGTSIYVRAALTNTGTLEGKGGGYLEASNLVTNSANVTTSTSSAVGLYGGWTNTGTITVNGGNLYLGGAFDQTKLGTVNRTGGNVYLTGSWNQTVVPAALNLNSSVGGSVIMLGGAFNGLNITGTLIPTTNGGTLNGVTYNGNLNFQNSNERLTVTNGLEVNGAVNFNHDYTRLEFTGTQSLTGTATVTFGNVYGAALRVVQSQTTLTLGPNVLVRGGSSQQITSRIGFDEAIGGPQDVFVINQGKISADVSGTSIYVRAALTNTGTLEGKSGGYLEASNLVTNSATITTSAGGNIGLYGGWTNTGAITVNGGNLYLGGTFDQTKLGTVNRTTGNVYLTGAWNQTVVPAALNLNSSVGGSVIMLGGAFNGLNITGTLIPTTSGGTLNGVTYNGNLNFQNSNERLTVTNGLDLNGAINFNHDYTRLEFAGTQSLTGTATVTFGNVYGAALRVTQSQTTLTLGPNVLVRGGSAQQVSSRIGFDEAIGGPQDVFVINQGTISADVAGTSIFVQGQSFTNPGTLEANRGFLLIGAGVTNYSAGTLTGGSWTTSNGGTLRLPSGTGVSTLNAIVLLDGAASQIEAGSGSGAFTNLATISAGGSLTIRNGRNFTTASGLTSNGVLTVGNNSTLSTSSLTISAGTLSGTGTISGPVLVNNTANVLPGSGSPGILRTGNLNLAQGSVFNLDLLSPYTTAGTHYDQLNVTGTVNLASTTLQLWGGVGVAAVGASLTIINNDGTDDVIGTFNGYSEGAAVNIGDFHAVISYRGGTGNDVVLIPVTLNHPPILFDQTLQVDENATQVGQVVASDPDLITPGDTLTFNLTGAGADAAKFTISSGGVLSFIVAPDYEAPTDLGAGPGNNTYEVEVRVTDAAGQSAMAIITVVVRPVNDNTPVITSSSSANVAENTTNVVVLTATDGDLPVQTLTFSIVGGADQDFFTISGGNQLRFVSAPDFENKADADANNVYVVQVQVSDNNGRTSTQTINVTITPVNDNSPVFTSATTATVVENTTAVQILAGTDADLPSQSLSFSLIGGADFSKFQIVGGNQLRFVSAPDFENPTDANGDNVYEVIVQVSDGTLTTSQTVSVSVVNGNEFPTAVADSANANEDGPSISIDLTANDIDPDLGDDLEIQSLDLSGTLGTVSIDPDSDHVTYNPNGAFNSLAPGATATDVFHYTVTDGHGATSVGTVTVTITGQNDSPTAVNDQATTPSVTSVTINVLNNDIDIDGGTLIVTAVQDPAHGTATISLDQKKVIYTPDAGFEATETFNYTISDGQGGIAIGGVSVIVNDSPTANDDSFLIDAEDIKAITNTALLYNDSDPNAADHLTITAVNGISLADRVVVTLPSGATLRPFFDSSGQFLDQFSYNPGTAFQALPFGQLGHDSFTYTISDGRGGSAQATVNLTVTGSKRELPDLMVTSAGMTFSPVNPQPGQEVTISAIVRNTGLTDSPGSTADFYLFNIIDVYNNGYTIPIDSVSIPALAAGATTTISVTTTFSVANLYNVVVRVNSNPAAEEATLENNLSSHLLEVGTSPAATATIHVTGYETSASSGRVLNVAGTAFYDFDALAGTDDYPVQGGSVTVQVRRAVDNSVVATYMGGRTDVAGNWTQAIVAPTQPGAYKLIYTVSDASSIGTADSDHIVSFNVTPPQPNDPPPPFVPVTPETPPPSQPQDPQQPLILAPGNSGGSVGGASSLPHSSSYVNTNNLYVYSENIYTAVMSSGVNQELTVTPQVGDWLRVFAYINFSGPAPSVGMVNASARALFPYNGQMVGSGLATTFFYFNHGAADSPTLVSFDLGQITRPGSVIIRVNIGTQHAELLNPNTSDDSATRLLQVGQRSEDTSIDHTVELVEDLNGDGQASPGDVIRYQITARNNTGTVLQDVGVAEYLDTALVEAPNSISNGGVLNDSLISWTIPTIAAHGSSIVSYTVKVRGDVDEDAVLGSVAFLSTDGVERSSHTVRVPITVNDASDAADDTATTDEDQSVIIDVLANDVDVDGDPLVVASTTAPPHGTVTINPDNTVTYTPHPNYHGPDSFTYTISDGHGGTGTATVTLQVNDLADVDVAVTASVNTTTANVGDEVIYTFTVTNNGPEVAEHVTLHVDGYGGQQVRTTSDAPAGSSFNGSEWYLDSIPIGATYTATQTIVFSAGDVGQTYQYVISLASSLSTDGVAGNNVASASVNVRQLEQTITFGPLAGKSYGDGPFDLLATSNSGLPVAFRVVSGPATVDGNTLTITGAGTVVVEASQAGDSAYPAAASVQQTFTVARKLLSVSATGIGKQYDGTTAAVVNYSFTGVINSDSVTASGTAVFNTKAVGTGKPITVTGITLTGDDAGNYLLGNSTANAIADITKAVLTPTITVANRAYNGLLTATITSRVATGAVAGEFVNVTGGTATFGDKDAETNKLVTITGLGLSGANAGNYFLNPLVTTTASITPKSLNATIGIGSKIYDGTVDATITTRTLTGLVAGDTGITLGTSGMATFGDKNVGTAKVVSVTDIALEGVGSGNYALGTIAVRTANITAKTLTGVVTIQDKVYDTTTSATIDSRTLDPGVVDGDSVSLQGGTAAFTSAVAGENRAVTVTGVTLGGDDATNYKLGKVIVIRPTIFKATLFAEVTVEATRVFNGLTTATIVSRGLNGILAADDVSLGTSGTANYADKNVGNGKTVTIANLRLTGTAARNYQLDSTTLYTTASITPKSLTATITVQSTRVYDGTTNTTIISRKLIGLAAGDSALTVNLGTSGTAMFDDKNVGIGKHVTVNGLVLQGEGSGNYMLETISPVTANITAKTVTATVTVFNKTFDGTTSATIATRTLAEVVAGDSVSLGDSGVASFSTSTVGNNKPVTITGLALFGLDAINYTVKATASAKANITP